MLLSDPKTPKSPESQHQAVPNFIDVTEPWPQEMTFMRGFFNSWCAAPTKGGWFWELLLKDWGKVTEENKVPTAPTGCSVEPASLPVQLWKGLDSRPCGSQLVFQMGIMSSDYFGVCICETCTPSLFQHCQRCAAFGSWSCHSSTEPSPGLMNGLCRAGLGQIIFKTS